MASESDIRKTQGLIEDSLGHLIERPDGRPTSAAPSVLQYEALVGQATARLSERDLLGLMAASILGGVLPPVGLAQTVAPLHARKFAVLAAIDLLRQIDEMITGPERDLPDRVSIVREPAPLGGAFKTRTPPEG